MGFDHGLPRVSAEFERVGFILESDSKLPSFVGLITGAPMQGSWWGHPEGRAIWRFLNDFVARRDVLATKLVSGKVTFVHRKLWPDLFVICTSKEKWQTEGLTRTEAVLLGMTEKAGEISTVDAKVKLGRLVSAAALELERRLLVQSEQFHTTKGSHAKRLRSWEKWSRGVDLSEGLPTTSRAKSMFELKLGDLNRKHGGNGALPWV